MLIIPADKLASAEGLHQASALSRRFLRHMVAERDALAAQLSGIDEGARARYAALLLSRLIALMLLQRHNLLGGDDNYLRRRIAAREDKGGQPSFYRSFLIPLFHQGLGASELSAAGRALLGAVPCLANDLFATHELERAHPQLDVADSVLVRVLAGLEAFGWSLDEADAAQAVTPALLGVLCEQGGDRQRLGAYYTDSDVSGYIAAASIIPWVVDAAGQACPELFGPQGEVWLLLRHDPDRYLHADVSYGVDLPLPADIAAGLGSVARRSAWSLPAEAHYGLPRETWREHIARRRRCAELRTLLRGGGLSCADDLVSANLDLGRFASAAIAACADPAHLLAFYHVLERLTVLDPTCGSGAFLVAALNVLEPLYLACLGRMAALASGSLSAALQSLLERVATYPNERAFVRGLIVTRNLYGVDIAPEAVACCKLRLQLLMLVAVGSAKGSAELDINIHCGDALSGMVHRSVPGSDTVTGGSYGALRQQPSVSVGKQQGGAAEPTQQHQAQPLDWSGTFPEVLERGGFEVVIGNPPYVLDSSAGRATSHQHYRTAGCGNLYALASERALNLLRAGGRLGMIVPVASVATNGMCALQELYNGQQQWHSHFAVRPARLFDNVDMNLTVTLLRKGGAGRTFSSGYRRWSSGARGDRRCIFSTLAYSALPDLRGHTSRFPKLGSALEHSILARMRSFEQHLGQFATVAGPTIYYHSGGRYWRKALPEKLSSHYKPLTLPAALVPVALALLNSQLFYWYWITHSNCMDVVGREVLGLPVFPLEAASSALFQPVVERLLAAYHVGRSTRQRRGRQIQVDEVNIDVQQAKPVIDEIDRLLAAHYGFDDEQLDFVLNYDGKYRCPTFESV